MKASIPRRRFLRAAALGGSTFLLLRNARSVWSAEANERLNVATAMGNQGTFSGAFRRALELIRNGTIGKVREVHVWNSAGGADRTEPPKGEPPVPGHLDWDLWLGPAAARPYHPEWLNRHLWRELGTCQLGNWGSHTANLPAANALLRSEYRSGWTL